MRSSNTKKGILVAKPPSRKRLDILLGGRFAKHTMPTMMIVNEATPQLPEISVFKSKVNSVSDKPTSI